MHEPQSMRWLRWLIGISMTDPGGEVFKGLGVSGGIAIGRIHVLQETKAAIRSFISAAEETRLLNEAITAAKAQIEALIASEDKLAGEILEFQLALLEDDDFLAPVGRAIAAGTPVDKAWALALDGEIAQYRSGGDVLAARSADLADLKTRVLHLLQGTSTASAELPAGAILVARELTPSGFLGLDWSRIGGAAMLGGSPTSHVAILARARDVALVVGLAADLDGIADGALAILDPAQGTLIVSPTAAALASAEKRIAEAKQETAVSADLIRRPARTARGEAIKILVNIDEPGQLDTVSPDICDGVGLTRTEFLFKGNHQPGEEEQLAFYTRLIEWAGGRPITVRTLDAGGDKPIPGVTIDGEANPFLGVRGLRLSLANPEVFRIQLRALSRAGCLGPLKVMVPMVTTPAELATARGMMDAEIAALKLAGVACSVPPMGMMVEVPAAALMAESFDADFYSIGSNDLIQYTLACARDNAALAPLADPLNPAILELIERTVAAGKRNGQEVSLCGDMASTPAHIGPLLSAGLRVLSCASAQIGPVKLAVSRYEGGGHG
jgi:phosphotransferase system enzyme I (PtsI)